MLSLRVNGAYGVKFIGGWDADGNRIEVQADETLLNKRKPSVLAVLARPQTFYVWLWGAVESLRGSEAFVFSHSAYCGGSSRRPSAR